MILAINFRIFRELSGFPFFLFYIIITASPLKARSGKTVTPCSWILDKNMLLMDIDPWMPPFWGSRDGLIKMNAPTGTGFLWSRARIQPGKKVGARGEILAEVSGV
jgi:hypothetical protein